jgi:gliding motility-associated lipoprotein GldH
MRSFLITGLFLFLIVSCNSDTLISETKPLPGFWDKDEVVTFTLPQIDSLKQYNVFLDIRSTNEYKYNNMFLIVAMQFPHGKKVVDTLEYRMANPDGSWLGEGIGNVKENKLWYKESVTFEEEGNYILNISHAMRNNGDIDGVTKLEGITDVGYSIEEAKQQ